MIYAYEGVIPVIHKSAYVHPQATVIGSVVIEADVYIGPSAVLRGDIGHIHIQIGSNVQEGCVLHMFPGKQVTLEPSSHIGHGAVIHGAHIGRNSLVGMNAVLMDDVILGEECIVGALSFVKAGTTLPARSLAAGNPARIIKQVSDEMIQWKTRGTQLYQGLPASYHNSCKEVKPLRDAAEQQQLPRLDYERWRK